MTQFTPLHNTTLIGSDIEQKCLEHLSQQGLKKVAKNFRSKLGEIDLIKKDNETIAFIEVRYRKKRHYGTPEETIDYYKRKKIILTIHLVTRVLSLIAFLSSLSLKRLLNVTSHLFVSLLQILGSSSYTYINSVHVPELNKIA